MVYPCWYYVQLWVTKPEWRDVHKAVDCLAKALHPDSTYLVKQQTHVSHKHLMTTLVRSFGGMIFYWSPFTKMQYIWPYFAIFQNCRQSKNNNYYYLIKIMQFCYFHSRPNLSGPAGPVLAGPVFSLKKKRGRKREKKGLHRYSSYSLHV